MRARSWRARRKLMVGVMLLACLVLRIPPFLIYAPTVYPDSGGYEALARSLQAQDFGSYTGWRTPVYPILMLLSGLDHWRIWAIQSLLGAATSTMLFWMALRRGHRPAVSILVGLVPSLALNQLFFEAAILTESLSAFLVSLSVFILDTMSQTRRRLLGLSLALGLVVSAASLTRPVLLCLAPTYVGVVWLQANRTSSLRLRLGQVCVYAAPIALVIAGWSYFNYVTVGVLAPTTLTGINLSNHSGAFIEHAPAKYVLIRDVYLRFREESVAETGTHSMTVFRALPAIQESTGLSRPEVSSQMAEMSAWLFWHYPHLYLKSVGAAWLGFWKAQNYWYVERIQPGFVRLALRSGWWIERALLVAANAGFLAITGLRLLRRARLGTLAGHSDDMVPILTVMVASITQALMEYGENGRYAIPFQPILLYVVLCAVGERVGGAPSTHSKEEAKVAVASGWWKERYLASRSGRSVEPTVAQGAACV